MEIVPAQMSISYRTPDFLKEEDHPIHRIRCPIHGFIHFSSNERKIIDHWIFRRLRYIKQLALTDFVYPGATHTRFEHSLGVMEVATRSFDMLASKRGDLLEKKFSAVRGFNKKNSLARGRQILRLASLLHDVGHVCFSHAAERVFFPDSNHAAFSQKIIGDKNLLGKLIDELYWRGCSELVVHLLEGELNLPPQLAVLHDLISGEMDVDRIDYLLRDSHHCGVDYGRFDHKRLIESLELYEDDDSDRLVIALNYGGLHAFEALILARYQMNTQVYFHRIRRIYDFYLNEYFEALRDEGKVPTNDIGILEQNDVNVMAQIFKEANSSTSESAKWAKRITERRHHKLIYDIGVNSDAIDKEALERLQKKLKDTFQDVDFLHDTSLASIHNLFVAGETEKGERVRIMLLDSHNNVLGGVGERSQVLGKIPKNFLCGRIYGEPNSSTSGNIEDVIRFAYENWKK